MARGQDDKERAEGDVAAQRGPDRRRKFNRIPDRAQPGDAALPRRI